VAILKSVVAILKLSIYDELLNTLMYGQDYGRICLIVNLRSENIVVKVILPSR